MTIEWLFVIAELAKDAVVSLKEENVLRIRIFAIFLIFRFFLIFLGVG